MHPSIGNKEMILPNHVNAPLLVFIPRCFPSFQGEMFTREARGVLLTGILVGMGGFHPFSRRFPHSRRELRLCFEVCSCSVC